MPQSPSWKLQAIESTNRKVIEGVLELYQEIVKLRDKCNYYRDELAAAKLEIYRLKHDKERSR